MGDARADVFEVAVGHYTSGSPRGGNADGSLWIPRVPVFSHQLRWIFFWEGRSCHSQKIYWCSCPLDGGSEMTLFGKLMNLLGTKSM